MNNINESKHPHDNELATVKFKIINRTKSLPQLNMKGEEMKMLNKMHVNK